MAKDYDDNDAESERNRPSDNPEVAALGDLGDYEVAEGYPDPRGWTVRAADGAEVGKVRDLIVDTGTMRTRYLEVELADRAAGANRGSDVLIPIGTARIDERGDAVLVEGLPADRIASLPAYERGSLTRDHETRTRSHFTSGDAFSAGAIGAGATGGSDFYDHDHFDDRRFFQGRGDAATNNETERLTVSEEQLAVGKRQVEAGEVGVRKSVETRHVEQEVPITREEVTVERRPISADSARETTIEDGEIRVPVMREEAVVEKRLVPTEEIIIRKTAVRDSDTVSADLKRERVEVDENSSARVSDDHTSRSDEGRANFR